MERYITPGVKRQIKALRKKYCEDICSEYYMRTGIPKVVAEMSEQSDKDIQRLKRENTKNTKEAIKNAKKASGKRLKEEDKLIFI